MYSLPRNARADVNGRQTAVYNLRGRITLPGGYWTSKDNSWTLNVWAAGQHLIQDEVLKTGDANPPLDRAMQKVKSAVEKLIKDTHGSNAKISYVNLKWER